MNWDNAADVALFFGLFSAIHLCVSYARRLNGERMTQELYSTIAGIVLAALFFGAAYAVHANHAAYYIFLGFYASAFLHPKLGRLKYAWAAVFAAYGTICILLLPGNFWIVFGAWTGGALAIVAGIEAYRRLKRSSVSRAR